MMKNYQLDIDHLYRLARSNNDKKVTNNILNYAADHQKDRCRVMQAIELIEKQKTILKVRQPNFFEKYNFGQIITYLNKMLTPSRLTLAFSIVIAIFAANLLPQYSTNKSYNELVLLGENQTKSMSFTEFDTQLKSQRYKGVGLSNRSTEQEQMMFGVLLASLTNYVDINANNMKLITSFAQTIKDKLLKDKIDRLYNVVNKQNKVELTTFISDEISENETIFVGYWFEVFSKDLDTHEGNNEKAFIRLLPQVKKGLKSVLNDQQIKQFISELTRAKQRQIKLEVLYKAMAQLDLL